MWARAKELFESTFTGFQWTTWKWAAILGGKVNGHWEQPLAVTSAIIVNEVVSTQAYGRILKKLESEDMDIAPKNTLWKFTLSNTTAGVTFYFVDSAVTTASSGNSLQLLWRCTGVFLADSVVHFLVGQLCGRIIETTACTRVEDLQSAYEAGVSAIAYTMADQLATYTSDYHGISEQSQKDALSSFFILFATAVALPLSRILWNAPGRCNSFFKNESIIVPNVELIPAPTLQI